MGDRIVAVTQSFSHTVKVGSRKKLFAKEFHAGFGNFKAPSIRFFRRGCNEDRPEPGSRVVTPFHTQGAGALHVRPPKANWVNRLDEHNRDGCISENPRVRANERNKTLGCPRHSSEVRD